jgi:N-acetylmuramoyl-L-alanine amidase
MSMRKTIVYCLFLTPILLLLPLLKSDKTVFNENLTPATEPIDSAGKVTILDENAEKDYRIKKVVIDAGHGGHDSGCRSSDGVEKKNTLAMALKLGQKIKDNFPAIEVIYTRDKDEFIELHRRAQIANKAKADLFISIHCNSTDESSGANGTETYVLGMHKKESNFAVAKRENASILLESDYKQQYDGFDPNSTEAYIIFSLFQNAYLDKSILFGKYIEESFKSNAGRKSLGVKQAGFIVLKETTMPSVLIETGFLNHSSEGEFISSSGGQATIAESIFLAFQKYKTAVETKTETPLIDATTEGVVFKIQLATASKDLSQTPRWKTMQNLEVVKDGAVFKYFKIGFATYNEANQDLKRLRANGYSDAFIVAYKNGHRVNLDEIKKTY